MCKVCLITQRRPHWWIYEVWYWINHPWTALRTSTWRYRHPFQWMDGAIYMRTVGSYEPRPLNVILRARRRWRGL